MKKLILIALFSLMMVSTAFAIPLAPGASVVPTGVASPGTTLLATITSSFSGTDINNVVWFTGTLTQWVRSSATGLVFEYQFTNDSTSRNTIKSLATTDFTNWTTNVNSTGLVANSGAVPSTISRDSSGSTVSAGIYNLIQGGTSQLLWIQTNAWYYTLGSTSLLDGGTASVRTYAPTIPEPGSFALLGMGLLGMIGYGKARFGKKAMEAVVDVVRDCVLVCVLLSRAVRGPDADQCHGLAVDGCGCADGDSFLRSGFARRITAPQA
jgi:hypothetical protein